MNFHSLHSRSWYIVPAALNKLIEDQNELKVSVYYWIGSFKKISTNLTRILEGLTRHMLSAKNQITRYEPYTYDDTIYLFHFNFADF